MRTQEEIVRYCKESQEKFLDFGLEVCWAYLDEEHARPFLTPESAADPDWQVRPFDLADALDEMRRYMHFAWEKVENHRGLSASRSISKMRAWCWLLERDDLVALCDDEEQYKNYGAPILKRICETFGFEIPDSEPLQRMARGLPCVEGCGEGCG